MNTKTEQKKAECPSRELLSAFYDGEASPETLGSHIETCPVCRTVLNDFARLDSLLGKALDAGTPPDLPERILVKVKTAIENSPKKKKFNIYSPAMIYGRIAALVAVLGIAGVIIWNDYSAKNAPPVQTPRVMHTAMTETELSPAPSSPRAHSASIDVNDLSTVNFSNIRDRNLTHMHTAADQTARAVIPDEVKQMWIIPENSDFPKMLPAILQAAGISPAKVRCIHKNDGNYTLEFPATKLESIKFVRLCKRTGYSLLTPGQPQPEQNSFAGNASDRITYSADFFRKK